MHHTPDLDPDPDARYPGGPWDVVVVVVGLPQKVSGAEPGFDQPEPKPELRLRLRFQIWNIGLPVVDSAE